MKTILLVALVLHCLIETLVGGVLVLSPTTLIADANGAVQQGLINQGMLALASVVLAITLWLNRSSRGGLKVGLVGLASFHGFVLIAAVINGSLLASLAGFTHHFVLALAFLFLFFNCHRVNQ